MYGGLRAVLRRREWLGPLPLFVCRSLVRHRAWLKTGKIALPPANRDPGRSLHAARSLAHVGPFRLATTRPAALAASCRRQVGPWRLAAASWWS